MKQQGRCTKQTEAYNLFIHLKRVLSSFFMNPRPEFTLQEVSVAYVTQPVTLCQPTGTRWRGQEMSQRGSQRTGGSRKTQCSVTKLRHAVNMVHIPTEKGEAASRCQPLHTVAARTGPVLATSVENEYLYPRVGQCPVFLFSWPYSMADVGIFGVNFYQQRLFGRVSMGNTTKSAQRRRWEARELPPPQTGGYLSIYGLYRLQTACVTQRDSACTVRDGGTAPQAKAVAAWEPEGLPERVTVLAGMDRTPPVTLTRLTRPVIPRVLPVPAPNANRGPPPPIPPHPAHLQQQFNTPIVQLDTVHHAHGPPPPLPPLPPPSMLNVTSGMSAVPPLPGPSPRPQYVTPTHQPQNYQNAHILHPTHSMPPVGTSIPSGTGTYNAAPHYGTAQPQPPAHFPGQPLFPGPVHSNFSQTSLYQPKSQVNITASASETNSSSLQILIQYSRGSEWVLRRIEKTTDNFSSLVVYSRWGLPLGRNPVDKILHPGGFSVLLDVLQRTRVRQFWGNRVVCSYAGHGDHHSFVKLVERPSYLFCLQILTKTVATYDYLLPRWSSILFIHALYRGRSSIGGSGTTAISR
ncbi:hypothetical protein GGX14DRAFT_543863 [Mycena pura]|uniref:Uncharacterized protein n=1 Tax=Mycena pura TaxID=153505 RepID=A0AAD6YAP7_9AGAR|nr:hypothetical protein GGX14DRAFT_543863 [Mycena pura]